MEKNDLQTKNSYNPLFKPTVYSLPPTPPLTQILEEGECEWYSKFYCNGEIVEDLSSWWFEVLCDQGTMKVRGFSLSCQPPANLLPTTC